MSAASTIHVDMLSVGRFDRGLERALKRGLLMSGLVGGPGLIWPGRQR